MSEERARLHTFYRAALAAYAQDQATARQLIGEVLSQDGGNPYYRWFVAGGAGIEVPAYVQSQVKPVLKFRPTH